GDLRSVAGPLGAKAFGIGEQRAAEEKRDVAVLPRRGFRRGGGMRQVMKGDVFAYETAAEFDVMRRRKGRDQPRQPRPDARVVIGWMVDEIDQHRRRA